MQNETIFDPVPGLPEDLGGGIQRFLAPNPSPMTYRGTNTYLLGDRTEIAVIDPGPDHSGHLDSILSALRPDQKISHIFVTHSHMDHSPLAPVLSAATGALVYAYGASRTGRSEIMEELARSGLEESGEGIDPDFNPDIRIGDHETIAGDGWQLTAHWTPGHLGNHLCFESGGAVFTGDLVMGWASSLVSPPDGDLTDFMASCRRLLQLDSRVFHSGHGAPIVDPAERLNWLIEHRLGREQSILRALKEGAADAETLAKKIYTDTPATLLPAATRNVLAHLIDLYGKSRVRPLGTLNRDTRFQLI